MEKESSGQGTVEANSTGAQGSRRAIAPSDDDVSETESVSETRTKTGRVGFNTQSCFESLSANHKNVSGENWNCRPNTAATNSHVCDCVVMSHVIVTRVTNTMPAPVPICTNVKHGVNGITDDNSVELSGPSNLQHCSLFTQKSNVIKCDSRVQCFSRSLTVFC
jgi:hypothetical protein